MKKVVSIVVCVTMLLFMLSACATTEPSTSESAATTSSETVESTESEISVSEGTGGGVDTTQLTFGVAHCVMGEDYWEADVVGMQKAADELGITLIVQSAQSDPTKQVEQIENFISQEVDAIICSPVDVNAILTSVKKCNEAGIPFVFNSRITESFGDAVVDSGVGYDALEMSKTGALWLVDYAKGKGVKLNILEVMGALSDSHSISCRDGLAAIAAENSDYIEVVTQVPSEWDTSIALSGTLSALQADDTINCIFYHSDALFPAIQSALMQLNKYVTSGEEGHIVLLACGGTADTLDAIRDGYVDALEVTPIVEVGYESVYQTVRLLNGEVASGESLLYDAYIIDASNWEELSGNAFGYAASN